MEYYQHIGWIDWEHAGTASADQLINEIRNALRQTPSKAKMTMASDFSGGGAERCPVPEHLIRTGYAQIDFQTPSTGVANYIFPRVSYVIRADLNERDLIPVALDIFIDYHTILETWEEAALSDVSLSGWSQEDPISDIIGFYRAINPELRRLDGGPLAERFFGRRATEPEALALMDRLGGDLGWRMNKSSQWDKPVNHNAKIPSFRGLPMIFPAEFQTIRRDSDTHSSWHRLEPRVDQWFGKLRTGAKARTSRLAK